MDNETQIVHLAARALVRERNASIDIPRISPLRLRWFQWYARRFVRKHFHSLRIAKDGAPPRNIEPAVPIVVVMNHPGWWDPMIALILSRQFWPDRAHFAPIDAAMLSRYRFFKKLGFFGVKPHSYRGGSAFLRTARSIVNSPRTCLWITAQGEFKDVRDRPLQFAPGLERLLKHAAHARVIPLAIEYPFWSERDPEALVRFGPVSVDPPSIALERILDLLASDAISKDANRFNILLANRSGSSPLYDAWRFLQHMFSHERSERFSTAHMEDIER